ncbi:hypothetical protein CQW23_20060 [Capsicum baccatum]|uniref:DUF3444 domain-containing protein n=1 Tax=Capsicum baccatum TaxID=33114 RepID=A0A2G2W7J0_CAPBA|nr:hypothetical protein CQW23_20060 [Capsicum baccatum]
MLPDGSTSYVGGITHQVIVKTGTKYHDFVNVVFERLCVDPSNIILHFTVKLDTSQLIELREQEDVNTLLQFNDSFAHVYASSLEVKPYSMPPSGGAKEIDFFVVSDSKPDATPAGDDENVLGSPLKKARFQSAGDSKPQLKEAVGDDGQKQAGVTKSCSSYVIWACYDADDEMPRCYALIKNVSRPEFKIKLRWLEPNPEYPREQAWILSDNEYGVGLLVGYLDKVSGFVSLFQSTKPTVVDTFFIKPKDYFRFSHRAPSFKMNGTEGEGVPEGSFELDIYALPINLDDIWYPGKVEEDSSPADSEPVENFWSPVPPGTRDVSRTPDDATTPLESGNLRGIHATDEESSPLVDLQLKLWFDGTQK